MATADCSDEKVEQGKTCSVCTLINKSSSQFCESCLTELGTDSHHELRLVLVGRSGNGKSSVGNSIANSTVFKTPLSARGVNKDCKFYAKCSPDDNFRIEITDTPGLFDVELTDEQTREANLKCLLLSEPGPNAFVIVLNINRFTREEKESVEQLRATFGKHFYSYAMVLFTGYDRLLEEGMTLQEYVKEASPQLQDLLKKCHQRYTAIDNIGKMENPQAGVHRLLTIVRNMTTENKPDHFTFPKFKNALTKALKYWAKKTPDKSTSKKIDQRSYIKETPVSAESYMTQGTKICSSELQHVVSAGVKQAMITILAQSLISAVRKYFW